MMLFYVPLQGFELLIEPCIGHLTENKSITKAAYINGFVLTSTYFIMERRVIIILNFIQVRIKIFNYTDMSNWRAFLSQNQDYLHTSRSNSHRKRFSPGKKRENSVNRLDNLSLSRIHDSLISGDQNLTTKQKERVKRYTMMESRMKNSSSQKSLKNKNIPNEESQDKKLNQESGRQKKSNDESPIKESRNIFYEKQIAKIQKQFKNFQLMILKQLQRQEQEMNQFVSQILQHLQTGQMDKIKTKIAEKIDIQVPEISQIHIVNDTPRLKIPIAINQSDGQGKKRQDLNFSGQFKIPIGGKQGQNSPNQRSRYSCRKFIEAMTNLKRQMNDLSKLSAISSPRSSRSCEMREPEKLKN